MRTDTEYSHINVCPDTGDQLSDNKINNSSGVCPHCGDITDYSFTHSKKIAGRWVRPSLYERIFQGRVTEFITKEDEDKIMKRLSQ